MPELDLMVFVPGIREYLDEERIVNVATATG